MKLKAKLRFDGLYDDLSMSMCVLPSLGVMVMRECEMVDVWFEWFMFRVTLTVYGTKR